jgi:hypothetical protein
VSANSEARPAIICDDSGPLPGLSLPSSADAGEAGVSEVSGSSKTRDAGEDDNGTLGEGDNLLHDDE